jgi:hypothetical protein
MRVVHDGAWLVRLMYRNMFCCLQRLSEFYQVGGLRSRWRCAFSLVPCREGGGRVDALSAGRSIQCGLLLTCDRVRELW